MTETPQQRDEVDEVPRSACPALNDMFRAAARAVLTTTPDGLLRRRFLRELKAACRNTLRRLN
jgi:hypothetical protein